MTGSHNLSEYMARRRSGSQKTMMKQSNQRSEHRSANSVIHGIDRAVFRLGAKMKQRVATAGNPWGCQITPQKYVNLRKPPFEPILAQL